MTLLLMFLYIAYAVYILVVTYRTYPAIMVEGTVAVSGIRRSGSLSKGQFCHVFLVLFIWWLERCAVNTLVTSTFETNGDGIAADLTFGSVGDGFLSIALAILFAALGSM